LNWPNINNDLPEVLGEGVFASRLKLMMAKYIHCKIGKELESIQKIQKLVLQIQLLQG
jgi:hypothetical protein